jgi:hypothetical protein
MWLLILGALLTACTASVDRPPSPSPLARTLTEEDFRWLNRVTFGLDSGSIAR